MRRRKLFWSLCLLLVISEVRGAGCRLDTFPPQCSYVFVPYDSVEPDERAEVEAVSFARFNIVSLPEEIIEFRNLKAIDLSQNPRLNLEAVVDVLAKLPHLQYLDISRCNLEEIPGNIRELRHLKVLILSANKSLRFLPDALADLPLEVLVCRECYRLDMEQAFEVLAEISTLRYLDFAFSQLYFLPWNSGKLTQVEGINLLGNLIVLLPPTMGKMESLRWVNLERNPWLRKDRVVEVLGTLPSLEVLNLAECELKDLPEFPGFPRLKMLDLSGNFLKKLHPSICQLDSLEVLILSSRHGGHIPNQLEALPSCFAKLQNLRVLKVKGNALEEFPELILYLPRLEYVDLRLNQIQRFPPVKRSRIQAPLRVLLLEGNRFSEVPGWLCALEHLEVLDLSGFYFHPARYKIRSLPSCLGKLSSLRVLRVNDQVLEALPETFIQLPELEILELRNNLLRELPDEIGRMPRLRRLILPANELLELPESLTEAQSLRILDLHFNYMTTVDALYPVLRQMTFLDTLDIRFIAVENPEIVDSLQRALPHTVILYQPMDRMMMRMPAWLWRKVQEGSRKYRRR